MRKYIQVPPIVLPNRTWPGKIIDKCPIWCSVDLRDGNQALANPMNPQQKEIFFDLLVKMGFKEIEVSFPSASKDDFDFTRSLINNNKIPDDCTIQILTQARENLIRKSFCAIRGSARTIVHLYNSTSPAQREIVFRKSRKEVIAIATDAVKLIRDLSEAHNGKIILEYSPESFSQTEIDFACDICNAVIDIWKPAKSEKIIINLPSTVEVTTPNVFADQIEYAGRQLICREQIILSVHTHNDRGCAVAAAELAQMAGAERVEGTLFGNGERTGNTDLITLALNLFSQGIDSGLDMFNIPYLCQIYEKCTGMRIAPRHPYAGESVFTAFSGSHQDAISKGLTHYKSEQKQWNVPYLPVDPADIGRTYDAVIRINSQSGKGGAAFILESVFGIQIPKEMHPALGAAVKKEADAKGCELSSLEVNNCFYQEFINIEGPYAIQSFTLAPSGVLSEDDSKSDCSVTVSADFRIAGSSQMIKGRGNGLIHALANALNYIGIRFSVRSFHEHSISEGSDARAVAYVGIEGSDSKVFYGAGIDTDIAFTSIKALISALNRMTSQAAAPVALREIVLPGPNTNAVDLSLTRDALPLNPLSEYVEGKERK